MKKTIKFTAIFAAALMALCACFAVQAADSGSYKIGDANGDSTVSIVDVTAIQKHTAEISVLSGNCALAADVNLDGKINVKDATEIQRYLAKYDNIYNIGKSVTVETVPPTTYWFKPGENELPFIPNY